MNMMWICLMLLCFVPHAQAKECVYINSYHQGYAWSDRIETAVRQGLEGQCHLTVFHMDTKRNTSTSFGEEKALQAKALIEEIKPDVVLVSDDNASKYLVQPYYKNADIPFAFSGINWSAKAYGYPYHNATGMIEVSAIMTLLEKAKEALGKVEKIAFIGVQGVRTDEKEYAWLKKTYGREAVKVVPLYVQTIQQWEQAYLKAQQCDFIVLNNVAGIEDWDAQRAIAFATEHANKLTVTTYDFMTPYSMFAMTKVAEEQGEWMVQLAKRVLEGKSLAHIPVVTNRRWNMFVNPALLEASSVILSEAILYKAVKVLP